MRTTCVERLAPDVVLESRLLDDGVILLVCIVDADSDSTAAAMRAVDRARDVLEDEPREVSNVEVRLGDKASRAIGRAQARRARRAARVCH